MGHILNHGAHNPQLISPAEFAAARALKPYADAREQAVQLPEDACTACGERQHMHYDTTGLEWVGCDGAIKRRHLGLGQNVHDTTVWGDQHPVVSRDIRAALQVACGPEVTVFVETLGVEGLTNLARRLAQVAITASLKVEGRK